MIERDEEAIKPERLTDEEALEPERVFEIGLRPQTLGDFVGQETLKDNLKILLEAAKGRSEPIEHVLLYGNPGLGKTTLAHIIAKEMNAQIRVTSGPALERVGDLAAILSNLQKGDILFIDEIHRLNKTIEEILYPAMEDYALDLVVGKGPTARTLRLNLEPFTIIGATTRLSLLSSPLRDRFGVTYHLNFYENGEIKKIIERNAQRLEVEAHPEAVEILSTRARRTPRIANRLLRRLRDFASVRGNGQITREAAEEALRMLGIDQHGLDEVDRHLLTVLIEKFNGGPVGIGTLAAASQEEEETIEEVYEPFLIQLGFLQRTPRGRMATPAAYEHLNKKPPIDSF
ncbi:MAG: Holliday junction branch migration DNA helicase RuvB [Patescibacteria group bacterium]|jgi:Holliday junction DNA helicase RuvB